MSDRGRQASRVLAAVAQLAVAATSVTAASDHPTVASAADAVVRAAAADGGLPSLSVAVSKDGKLVYAGAHGSADLENEVLATVTTVYPLGSITKPVTAVAALRLAAQGALDLDAPIQSYCPAFPEKAHPITVRQLLAHLGGVRHYDYRRFEEDFLNRRHFASIHDAIGKFAGDSLVAEPGTKYHYSSWGYVLVGCAIEGASRMSYAEFVRTAVLEPAKMRHTRLDVIADIVPHRARGYSRDDAGARVNAGCFDASDRYPAGGLVGTPTDLVLFSNALLDGRLLDAGSLKMMWSSQRTVSGGETGHGLGWDLAENGAEVFQGGTSVGATGYLYVRPQQRVAVALLTNLSLWTKERHALAQRLADIAARANEGE
jgi:CubicO group peptidase (beta-lactamase class C family)